MFAKTKMRQVKPSKHGLISEKKHPGWCNVPNQLDLWWSVKLSNLEDLETRYCGTSSWTLGFGEMGEMEEMDGWVKGGRCSGEWLNLCFRSTLFPHCSGFSYFILNRNLFFSEQKLHVERQMASQFGGKSVSRLPTSTLLRCLQHHEWCQSGGGQFLFLIHQDPRNLHPRSR